jgi:hypothetical protein
MIYRVNTRTQFTADIIDKCYGRDVVVGIYTTYGKL